MSFGSLYWASILGTRATSTRFRDFVLGSLSFASGLLVIGTTFGVQALENSRINQWVEVHDEHFKPSSFPDVHEIRGSIKIKPGRSLSLDLTLDVSVDIDQDREFVLFSLNPGYNISHLAVAGEEVSDSEFQHGLLKIPGRYFTLGDVELEITATGRPDRRFAYLDSVDTLSQIVGPEVRQLRQLGTENSIFQPNFVALPPGIKWYPTSGTATNEDAWDLRTRDYFTLNIEVSTPQHWLVAGPAKRETLDDDKQAKYRFQQSSPLPEFALIGSRFESASIEVEGISFECLYAKIHRRKFERFSVEPGDQFRLRITRRLEHARSMGMEYPYGSFALVEVPSNLRVFGGGVEMDTAMHSPGIVMIRESTLPTTTVDIFFDGAREEIMERFNYSEQDFVGLEIDSISSYLENPMFESNYNIGFYRSLHFYQTSATGEGARALNTLMELLVRTIYWGAKTNSDFQSALNRKILNLTSVDPLKQLRYMRQKERVHVSDEMLKKQHNILNSPEVWDSVATFGLFDPLTSTNSTLKMRALKFRTQRLDQLFRDALGHDHIAPFLVDLINRFRGRVFTFDEFEIVATDHGVKLSELAGDLIDSASLPGFLVFNPSARRSDDDDQPTYESTFVLQNREPVSGPIQLSLTFQNETVRFGQPTRFPLNPILIEANQSLRIVVESSNPVQYVWVEPYLSLNRLNLRVDMPASEQFREQEFIPDANLLIKSITAIDQIERTMNTSITIDDLDPGFSVVELDRTSSRSNVLTEFVRKFIGKEEVLMDQGLPKYTMFDRWRIKGWSRWADPTAFGIYRRTFAIADNGDGLAFAKFNTTLPHTGKWELEYFLPKGHFFEEFEINGSVGSTTSSKIDGPLYLEVRKSSTATNHTVDVPNLSPGWHSIGSFDMSAEEVDVLVSNRSDKRAVDVVADAIRWTPIKKGIIYLSAEG